jgi:hypothetical protein
LEDLRTEDKQEQQTDNLLEYLGNKGDTRTIGEGKFQQNTNEVEREPSTLEVQNAYRTHVLVLI